MMVASSRNQHKVGMNCPLSKDDDKIGESTSTTNQKNVKRLRKRTKLVTH